MPYKSKKYREDKKKIRRMCRSASVLLTLEPLPVTAVVTFNYYIIVSSFITFQAFTSGMF